MIDFVHLHNHSEYSLLDSTNRVDWIASRVKENGMNAIALTDHGTAAGWIEFQSACKKTGVKPILGMEAYQSVTSRFEKGGYYHLILLAEDEVGYKNLLRLSYFASTEGFYRKPRIDKELLKTYSNGIICMSACLASETSRKIIAASNLGYEGEDSQDLTGDDESLLSTVEWYKKLFGDRYYLELQLNGIDAQNIVNEKLVELSNGLNIPLVLTNDCHYTNPEHSKLHETMFCIRDRKVLSDPDRYKFSGSGYWIKSPLEVHVSIETENGALDKRTLYKAAETTLEIASRCNAATPTGKFFFPEIKSQNTPENTLRQLALDGLKEKGLNASQAYLDRLEYELDVICRLGFAPYFLVVADYMNWARENKIVVGPGRGSAAGCLIAFLVNITGIDPIKYDLYFERFLNESRGAASPPDIDSDFADRDRIRVINYLKSKYGNDKVANIATYGMMAAKSAVRNSAFVLGHDFATSNKIIEYVPDDKRGIHAKLTDVILPHNVDKDTRNVFDLAKELEGSIRTQSVHASGIVIAPSHIADFAPVCKTSDGGIAVEWTMNEIEKAGLVKFDILGLRNLSVIGDCLELIKQRHNFDLNLYDIPDDDPKAFQLICDGNVTGIFQLEASKGIAELAKRLAPKSITELSAIIALYRPGPLDTILGNYIARKEGREEVEYPLGLQELAPVLDYTYGLYVYQEQIMKIAQIVSGYSLVEADNLRKAIGKKLPEEMAKHRDRFINGRQPNLPEEGVSQLFDDITHFAHYCLIGSTKILTVERGPVSIAEIVEGKLDLNVFSIGPKGQVITQKIEQWHDRGVKNVFLYTFEDGTSEICTPDHKFLTADKQMMPIDQIFITGEQLFDTSGLNTQNTFKTFSGKPVKVISKRSIGLQNVYDIGVPIYHNFVLASKKVASNCFNKSHSLAYAKLGLWTAYLKAHFNIEFQTALINSEVLMSNDIDSRANYIQDTINQGISVNLPSVNIPASECVIETPNSIRLGLSCIKGLSINAANYIRDEFFKNGKYLTLSNFFTRMNNSIIRSNSAEAMAQAGVFDCFGDRNKIIANLADIRANVIALKGKNIESDYFKIFKQIHEREPHPEELAEIELKNSPKGFVDFAEGEKNTIGISPSKTSFNPFVSFLKKFKWNGLKEIDDGLEYITSFGIVNSIKEITTKTNQQMAFIQLKIDGVDKEFVCFPQVWALIKPILVVGGWYIFTASQSRQSYAISKMQSAMNFVEKNAQGLAVEVNSKAWSKLKESEEYLNTGESDERVIYLAPVWGAKHAIKLLSNRSMSELLDLFDDNGLKYSIL